MINSFVSASSSVSAISFFLFRSFCIIRFNEYVNDMQWFSVPLEKVLCFYWFHSSCLLCSCHGNEQLLLLDLLFNDLFRFLY